MGEKYRGIDYKLLPNCAEMENPESLLRLLDDAPFLFTGVAKESWVVPAPGDFVEYKDSEKTKHPGELKLLKELGFPDGNKSGTYQVMVRKFYEPKMEGMMILLGIRRV